MEPGWSKAEASKNPVLVSSKFGTLSWTRFEPVYLDIVSGIVSKLFSFFLITKCDKLLSICLNVIIKTEN